MKMIVAKQTYPLENASAVTTAHDGFALLPGRPSRTIVSKLTMSTDHADNDAVVDDLERGVQLDTEQEEKGVMVSKASSELVGLTV